MKKYPEYKDSGIEWIGEIPQSWTISRLKYLAHIKTGYTPPKNDDLNYSCDGIPWIKPDDLNGFQPIFETKNKTSDQGLRNGNLIEPNSVLMCCIGSIGKMGVSGCQAITNQQINSLTFNSKVNNEFAKYLVFASQEEHIREANGNVIKILNSENQKNITFPLPAYKEQQKIAQFLDDKIKRIESLIKKKKELIELLKEERAAIINQAVTKGINPDAEMKDSGIEWLGEVPKHWNVSKLKYLSRIRYGLGQPPKQVEGGLPMIRATNVERGRIVKKDMMFVSSEDVPKEREPFLCENEIIVVRSGAYTADSAIIPKEYEGAVAGYDMVVTPKAIQPKFLSYGLLSQYMLNFQLDIQKLRAAQPHLNAEELGATLVLCPPFHEQTIITEYITKRVSEIDKTIELAIKEISLIEEYRTALINEAVTGKIKVTESV